MLQAVESKMNGAVGRFCCGMVEEMFSVAVLSVTVCHVLISLALNLQICT